MKNITLTKHGNMMRLACLLLSAAVLFGAAHASAEEKAQEAGHATSPADVVAMVNGVEITAGDFARHRALYMQKKGVQETNSSENQQILQNLLMQQVILMSDRAEKTAESPAVQRQLEEFKKNLVVETIIKEVTTNVPEVSEEEMQAYYEANKQDILSLPMVDAAVIMVKSREEAEAAKKRLDAGEDFVALVQELSIDVPTASKDGYLGRVQKGSLNQDIEKVLFSLNEGQVSDIVETKFGFNIFKVADHIEPAPMPYDQVQKKIRTLLTQQRSQAALRSFFNKLTADADIQIVNKDSAENEGSL
jgi:parvulin-like peptidyl-prolyl isomerase